MALTQAPLNWVTNLCGGATELLYSSNNVAAPERTIIQNVHIWDGEQHIPNTSVVIEGRAISLTGDATGAKKYDGKGGYLLPGLIDSHVHASAKKALDVLAHYGITTAFDMGSFPSSDMPQWHDVGDQGLTSLLFSGAAATYGSGFPAILPGFPKDTSTIKSADDATRFVKTRVSEGVDYLKIFIDSNGLPKQEYQEIIKSEADKANRSIVSHAPDYAAQRVAWAVGGKFVTHLPKDAALNETDVQEILSKKQIAIPTLIMMKHTIDVNNKLTGTKWNFTNCSSSVGLMHDMGVPILVGTDSNKILSGLVLYGISLHSELQLLSEAGMKTEDVLKSATSLPAHYFGLDDRGLIRPGKRADLLLLTADPFQDITNSKKIKQIWTAGTQVKGLFGSSHASLLDDED